MPPNTPEVSTSRKRKLENSFSDEDSNDEECQLTNPPKKRPKGSASGGFQLITRAVTWVAGWARRFVSGEPLRMEKPEEGTGLDGDSIQACDGGSGAGIPTRGSHPLTHQPDSAGHPCGVSAATSEPLPPAPPQPPYKIMLVGSGTMTIPVRSSVPTCWENYTAYEGDNSSGVTTVAGSQRPTVSLAAARPPIASYPPLNSAGPPTSNGHGSWSAQGDGWSHTPGGSTSGSKQAPRGNCLWEGPVPSVNGSAASRSNTTVFDCTFGKAREPRRPAPSPVVTKQSTLKKMIDLEEKRKYRQLLSKYTSLPFKPRYERALASLRAHSPSQGSPAGAAALLAPPPGPGAASRVSPLSGDARQSQKAHDNARGRSQRSAQLDGSYLGSNEAVKPRGNEARQLSTRHEPASGTASDQVASNAGARSRGPVQVTEIVDWIDQLTVEFKESNAKTHRQILEAKAKAEVLAEWRIQREKDLERAVKLRARLAGPIPAVFPYQEVSEEEEEEEEEDLYPPLSAQAVAEVQSALAAPQGHVVVEKFRLRLTSSDLLTLQGANWLNDEVINYFMNLLAERGEAGGPLKVYCFNTFFYPKIMETGQSAVKRWTRKVDVFGYDLILVPVHKQVHWCMAAINLKERWVRYYDSMGSACPRTLNALLRYLVDEYRDKKGSTFDTSGWTKESVQGLPQQENGSDCGVFACQYAECLSRDRPITFTQAHMPYFRKRMTYEILSKKLM